MKYLLFDVDDTLLDFQAAEAKALKALFASEGYELTAEMSQRYQTMNKQLWQDFEKGKIDRDEVTTTRFSRFFKEYGKTVNGVSMDQRYRSFLNQGTDLMPAAKEVLTALQPDYQLYVVTNGVQETQEKRLAGSGLRPFFQDVFVSETTGYHKPMKEFFDYAFERIPHFDPQEAMIIGDSLSSDIQGGKNVGIETVWYNNGQTAGVLRPDYEIHQLPELLTILKKDEKA